MIVPPLRWGVLGCGKIANDFVRSLRFSRHPHQVVAVGAARGEVFAKEFCAKARLNSAAFFGNYAQVLRHADVDVLYVANLNAGHRDWVMRAIEETKKPVLCEKPLGVNVGEVEEMAKIARHNRIFLMEALWSVFLPTWQYIRRCIEDSANGPVLYSGANFGIVADKSRMDLVTCETPLMDIGMYTIAFGLFAHYPKYPIDIQVHGECKMDAAKKPISDLWANITLNFAEGRHALCSYSGLANGSNQAFVSMEKRQIQIPEFFWAGTRTVEFELPPRAGVTQSEERWHVPKDWLYTPGFVYNNSFALHYQADHVYECLKNGLTESPVWSLNDSIRLHKIVTEVRRKLKLHFETQDQRYHT